MSNLITLRGVLVTPRILATSQGNYDVQEETFYSIGVMYYFQLDQSVYPWRIVKAIQVRQAES